MSSFTSRIHITMDTAARWTVTVLLLMTITTSYCHVVTSHSSTEASSSSTTAPETSTKHHSITEDLEKTHALGPEDEDEDIFEILRSTKQPHVTIKLPTVEPDTENDDDDTENDDDDTADLVPPAAPTERPAGIGLLIISIIHSVKDEPIRSQTTVQPDDEESADNQMSNHDLQTSNFVYPPYQQRFYPYYSRPYAFNSPYFRSYPSNNYFNWPLYSNENRLAHLF